MFKEQSPKVCEFVTLDHSVQLLLGAVVKREVLLPSLQRCREQEPTSHVETEYCALERRKLPLGSGLANVSVRLWDPSPMFTMRQ